MKLALSFGAMAAVAIGLSVTPVHAAEHAASVPPAEYIDRGACPFECCVYRDWKTNREVTLVDKPGGAQTVVKIPAGASVNGVTGQVISKPMRHIAVRDLETQSEGDNAATAPIRKGDTYYVLHYAGEGYWAVWLKGHVVIAPLEAQDGAPQKDASVWWVQIRTGDGKTGWAISTDNFDNQDSCG